MYEKQAVKFGQFVKKAMRLRGGGSALPGLVVEKLAPRFLQRALADLPFGVVVVTGTNGKTTTTKIVVELLKAHGLQVFTNPSGSNFTRGIVASLLDRVDEHNRLPADIAVVELDEAHAVAFAKAVAPDFTLVLNVFRDQLDRFGEIDHTARLLRNVVEKTTKGVVLNRDDELTRALQTSVKKACALQYFGVDESLAELFPSDERLRGPSGKKRREKMPVIHKKDVLLHDFTDHDATFLFGKKSTKPVELRLSGSYNMQNAAAALTVAQMILAEKFDQTIALTTLARVRPAFGRGEAVEIDGEPLEIVLVKNPSGFRLSLQSYAERPAATMIAINDQYADGRDMSWLWDVDFRSLSTQGVSFVSGIRAYDMALRLQYDDVPVGQIIPSIPQAVAALLAEPVGPKRIFCTYTAMLTLRRELAKQHSLEAIE